MRDKNESNVLPYLGNVRYDYSVTDAFAMKVLSCTGQRDAEFTGYFSTSDTQLNCL